MLTKKAGSMLDSTDEQPQSTSSSTPMRQVLGRVAGVAGAGAGGDGDVTSFKDHGGHLLTQVQVVLIFWGTASAWAATPAPAPFLSFIHQVVEAIQPIPSGPYLTKLKQYRGIGR